MMLSYIYILFCFTIITNFIYKRIYEIFPSTQLMFSCRFLLQRLYDNKSLYNNEITNIEKKNIIIILYNDWTRKIFMVENVVQFFFYIIFRIMALFFHDTWHT